IVAPNGSVGFRWGEGKVNGGEKVGRWNLEQKDGGSGKEVDPLLSPADKNSNHGDDYVAEFVPVGFPYYGGEKDDLLIRNVPAKKLTLADGTSCYVTTVYDLQMANYGVDRGFGGGNVASSYDDDVPYTPAWQE